MRGFEDGPVLPPGVAVTAATMAREREVESLRADRLFEDPFAGSMVAAARRALPDTAAWPAADVTLGDLVPALAGFVPMRTRWIDDRIRAAVVGLDGPVQAVLLGAGLDTRAARLPWPAGTTVFTVDQPGVVAVAGRVLDDADPQAATGAARRVGVGTDLAGDWVPDLLAAGFDRETPTVWVVEGLLMYLDDAAAEALLARVRALAGGVVIMDLAHPNIGNEDSSFAEGHRSLRENGSPLRSAPADPVGWLAGLGWRARVADPHRVAAECGRPVPAALAAGSQLFVFVEATADGQEGA